MKNNTQFSAFLYKSTKNNVYIANCYSANVAGYGKTVDAAVENLQKSLLEICGTKNVQISLLEQFKICNG